MPRTTQPVHEVIVKGKKRWRVVVSITKDGKRSRVSKTFDRRVDALRFYADHQRGAIVATAKDTFNDLADDYMATNVANGIRPHTAVAYRNYIRPAREMFGHRKVQDIRESDIATLVKQQADAGWAKISVSHLIRHLRRIFRLAIRRYLILRDPTDGVIPVGRVSVERDALTPEELAQFREHIRGHRHEACLMLTLVGLRRSELAALTWGDIDFVQGTVTISKSRVNQHTGATKSRNSDRVLPLDPERLALLRDLRAEQATMWGLAQARDGYLLLNDAGRPLDPTSWSILWPKLSAEAGVRVLNLHAARHSTVTFMRNAGVPDHIVAAWHGHDEVVMRRVYSHADKAQLSGAASVLNFGSGDAEAVGTS